MRYFLSACLAAAALALASPASATTADAQAAIAALKDNAQFFAATSDGKILHKQSGLVCATKIGDSDRVRIVVVDSGKARDVRCEYKIRGLGIFTAQVTKLPPGLTGEMLMPVAVQSAVADLKDPKPLTGIVKDQLSDPKSGAKFEPSSVSYTNTFNMQVYLMRIWLDDINGWGVKVFASYMNLGNSPGEGWGRSLWIASASSVQRQAP